MSNALLEALAAGLPIIATDVGDNPFLIRDQVEGRIVPADNPDAIRQTLHQFVVDAGLRDRYAQAARARASHFPFDRMVDAYEAYYEALVGTSPVASRGARQLNPSAQPA